VKFLILTQYFAPEIGATQVRLGSLCRELAAAGHSVEIVTAMPHHPKGRIFRNFQRRFYLLDNWNGFPVHRVWLYAASGSSLKRILSYLSFCLTCLFGLARASKPDYIFVDSPPPFLGVPGWVAAKLWRVPLVFNVADLWPDSARDLGVLPEGLAVHLGHRLERWVYRHADYVTAVTDGIRDTFLGPKRLATEKILFLPNGVDANLFQPRPGNDGLKRDLRLTDKRIILYAGNHGYAGSVETVLYAANWLRNDPAIHFLLVGDGPEKPNLQRLSAQLALHNVTFHDSVPLEAMPEFISISDLAVVTLRKSKVMAGARPAKAFVMMASGKPIVLAGEGEPARLIEQSGAGVVVPPEDHRSLATALCDLLEDRPKAEQMGEAGRAFVVANFQWPLLVRNWLAQLSKHDSRPALSKGKVRHAENGVDVPLIRD
jgi:colanic acid biosynthesis glycosyl transferase WcaI